MTAISDTRYADCDGVEIAYHVIGDRGPTFVGIPGLAQNIEMLWDEPRSARFLERFGSFCRLIHFDKRGTGLSGRIGEVSSFPERVMDLEAVMDAEKIERAFMGGFSEGGPMTAFFAATNPDRVEGLVLLSTAASFTWRPHLPWNMTMEQWTPFSQEWARLWGTGRFTIAALAPSMADDDEYVRWMGRYERHSTTPAALMRLQMMNGEIDISDILPSISVPTLVIHRDREGIAPQNGRYLAEHIPGARYVELSGRDHLPWIGDQDAVLDAIEEFVTGHRPQAPVAQRVLSTVLFTDIVDSTKTAVALGDAEWRKVLNRHDELSGHAVGRNGGRVVKTTGDGLLATFDSPSGALYCATELSRDRRLGVEVRCGIHTGEIELRNGDVAGVGVHIASRVQGYAGPGEVVATSTVRDLTAGAPFVFEDRGAKPLKGLPNEWQLFLVRSAPS